MEAKARTKKFWTFLVTKVEYGPGSMQETMATVSGYFVYVTIMVKDLNKDLHFFYLTPPEEPMKFRIPPWFFEKTVDRVHIKDVVARLVRVFKTPIEVVDPRPLDESWDKVPPSKRRRVQAEKEKERLEEFKAKPPEEGL